MKSCSSVSEPQTYLRTSGEVIIKFETLCVCLFSLSTTTIHLYFLLCVYGWFMVRHGSGLVPLCPARPPGAEVCPTSGTVWWFLQWAEDPVSLEHTAPSGSPDGPSSCNNNTISITINRTLTLSPQQQEAANARVSSLSFIIHVGVSQLLQTRLYLLWIFSSTFSAQNAFTSKSTPQA